MKLRERKTACSPVTSGSLLGDNSFVEESPAGWKSARGAVARGTGDGGGGAARSREESDEAGSISAPAVGYQSSILRPDNSVRTFPV